MYPDNERHRAEKPQKEGWPIWQLLSVGLGGALIVTLLFLAFLPSPQTIVETEIVEPPAVEVVEQEPRVVLEESRSEAQIIQDRLFEIGRFQAMRPAPTLLRPVDISEEPEQWKLIRNPSSAVKIGLPLSSESMLQHTGLREMIANLNMPTLPTRHEVAEALGRLGKTPVLVEEFSDGTLVTIGVHFGITTAVHHTEQIYEPGRGKLRTQEQYSLLIPHPQRMITDPSEDISEERIRWISCEANPEMYYRAMLLVDFVIWEQTGYHVKIYDLEDPGRFFNPAFSADSIARNACLEQE